MKITRAPVMLGLVVASMFLAGPAFAWTGSPTATTFTVTYTEPTTNTAGGSPALVNTTVYYRLGAGTESSVVVPASSPDGGGTVTRTITVLILPGQVGTVSVQVTASNLTGESARTAEVTATADRTREVVR